MKTRLHGSRVSWKIGCVDGYRKLAETVEVVVDEVALGVAQRTREVADGQRPNRHRLVAQHDPLGAWSRYQSVPFWINNRFAYRTAQLDIPLMVGFQERWYFWKSLPYLYVNGLISSLALLCLLKATSLGRNFSHLKKKDLESRIRVQYKSKAIDQEPRRFNSVIKNQTRF